MAIQSLDILSLLASSERPLQMKEIRAGLDIPRSSAFRLVEELLAEGWLVAQGSPRRYSASWKTATLGLATVHWHPHRDLLFPQVVGMAADAGLPAHLAFYEDGWTYFSDIVEVVGGRVVHTSAAYPQQAFVTAAGRAILAHLPREEVEVQLARKVERLTKFTKTDPDELRAEIAQAHERGYAVAQDEVLVGSGGIAIALLDENRQPVASLGLHGLDRVHAGQIEPAAVILLKWARRASTLVGSRAETLVS
jgi:DNA-binding IclR family transcriptional regulator